MLASVFFSLCCCDGMATFLSGACRFFFQGSPSLVFFPLMSLNMSFFIFWWNVHRHFLQFSKEKIILKTGSEFKQKEDIQFFPFLSGLRWI